MIINEVVDFAKKSKKECFNFKVDFEKAYDSVNWKLLEYMMGRFSMNEKWKVWIKECVFKGDLLVLIDGSPTKEVTIHKGLKQGNPVASFLFLMVVEELTGMMKKAVDLGISRGLRFAMEGRRYQSYNMQTTLFWWEKLHGKICGQ